MKQAPGATHDYDAEANEALDRALALPPGAERSEAMKKAGQLRARAEAAAHQRPGHYPSQRIQREGE